MCVRGPREMHRRPDNPGSGEQHKIVFVNRYFHPDQSATSRILSDLAFRLAGLGVSVTVVTSRQLYGDPAARLAPNEVVRGVTVHRVATATRGRSNLAGRTVDYATFYVAAGIKLLQILLRGDVVVAKTDPPLVSIPVGTAARWKRAVFVNWLQDLFPEVAGILAPNLIPGWLAGWLATWRDHHLRKASMNIVLGRRMQSRLRTRGIDDSRITEIPNWSDPGEIVPLASEASGTRTTLGLTGKFVVGYSGNFGRAHEFDTLLGAARLLEADRDFAFLMTGAGAKRGGLQEAVRRQGLSGFVFQDFQPPDRLSDSMAAADVHLVSLLPALEGLIVPSKIYGILAAGRPAIFIGDTGGDVAALLSEHDCGIAVSAGDSRTLASQLRSLRRDPKRIESMGRRARELAVSRFTGERAAVEWLKLLHRVAPQVCPQVPVRALTQARRAAFPGEGSGVKQAQQ